MSRSPSTTGSRLTRRTRIRTRRYGEVVAGGAARSNDVSGRLPGTSSFGRPSLMRLPLCVEPGEPIVSVVDDSRMNLCLCCVQLVHACVAESERCRDDDRERARPEFLFEVDDPLCLSAYVV